MRKVDVDVSVRIGRILPHISVRPRTCMTGCVKLGVFLLSGLVALPVFADEASRLVPGSYVQNLTADVEIVDAGSGTIVDSWTDWDVYAECRDSPEALALDPGIAGDERCTFRETGRAGGHVDFAVRCSFPDKDMTGTGFLDFSRADLTGFDQHVTLKGYAAGLETTTRITLAVRREGECEAELH